MLKRQPQRRNNFPSNPNMSKPLQVDQKLVLKKFHPQILNLQVTFLGHQGQVLISKEIQVFLFP
jgi:hypothetical protein